MAARTLRIAIAMLLAVAGCTTETISKRSESPSPKRAEPATAVEAKKVPIPEIEFAQKNRPIRNVLVISSGGMNGAYPAGVLKGWSESGRRPEFDVVTGVSTGALLGTLAFLGPDFDEPMERLYTTLRPWDVFLPKPPVPWSDSLAVASPLRNHIERQVTQEVLDRIAAEHRKGRRLYVGTTRLRDKQLVIWDMGAIAAGDDPNRLELFRMVLLASCSIPGLLPPVSLDVELDGEPVEESHVDGGVASSLFLRPSLLGVNDVPEIPPPLEGANVYVLISGKLRSEEGKSPRTILHMSSESFNGMLQSRMRGDLLHTYLLCWRYGANFHLTAIPDDIEYASVTNSVTMGPEQLRELFALGVQSSSDPAAWYEVPPGLRPEEQLPPRGNVKLATKRETGILRGWDGISEQSK